MIVVDANTLIYLWVPGYDTLSQELLRADADWHAPAIWLSEVRNVLLTHFRHGLITGDNVLKFMTMIENQVIRNTHVMTSAEVLETGLTYGWSAYDSEYVSLAIRLAVPLITYNKKLLKGIPDVAMDPRTYLLRR